MKTSSAPGKIYLFGEHAVVYGEPAVAAAVNCKATAKVSKRPDKTVSIKSRDLGISGLKMVYGNKIELETIKESSFKKNSREEKVPEEFAYTTEAAKSLNAEGVTIEIESDIPVGSGLGSSAAVTVATIHAISRLQGKTLSRKEIASKAFNVERKVQGAASPTDTYLASNGGINLVQKKKGTKDFDFKELDFIELELVAGDTGEKASTGQIVADVKKLKENFRSVKKIISNIGEISREGVEKLNENDLEAVGKLMNINHGLLESLGVSTPLLSKMVHTAREAGSSGAKITGAGGGGCMVSLGAKDAVKHALKGAGAKVFDLKSLKKGVEAVEDT